jgi:hypothetical protein
MMKECGLVCLKHGLRVAKAKFFGDMMLSSEWGGKSSEKLSDKLAKDILAQER